MCTQVNWLCVGVCIFMSLLSFEALSYTNDFEVQTLREMYMAMGSPPQLDNWNLNDGHSDPCKEAWRGVGCSGPVVTQINLKGLNLTGIVAYHIFNLQSLKHLDLSFNSFEGEIPYHLPRNLSHIILACNNFTHTIPHSINTLEHLKHLNLSHNQLSGQLDNIFSHLNNLQEMDLSYNSFFGDLPPSFEDLTSLKSLCLQSNLLTGSIIHLSGLPLQYLNIEDNMFSGILRDQIRNIRNLWYGGNNFESYSPLMNAHTSDTRAWISYRILLIFLSLFSSCMQLLQLF